MYEVHSSGIHIELWGATIFYFIVDQPRIKEEKRKDEIKDQIVSEELSLLKQNFQNFIEALFEDFQLNPYRLQEMTENDWKKTLQQINLDKDQIFVIKYTNPASKQYYNSYRGTFLTFVENKSLQFEHALQDIINSYQSYLEISEIQSLQNAKTCFSDLKTVSQYCPNEDNRDLLTKSYIRDRIIHIIKHFSAMGTKARS